MLCLSLYIDQEVFGYRPSLVTNRAGRVGRGPAGQGGQGSVVVDDRRWGADTVTGENRAPISYRGREGQGHGAHQDTLATSGHCQLWSGLG